MNRNNYLILTVIVLLFASCHKLDPVDQVTNSNKTISELNIPSGFDWTMSRTVMFHVNGNQGDIIEIKTTDATKTIYKGIIPPGKNSWEFRLNLPDFITGIMINGKPFQIDGSDVYYSIPQTKSVLLTNYALLFDGVDDYVNIGDPAGGELDFGTGDFTCEARVYTNNAAADIWYRRIFGKGFKYSCYVYTDGTVQVYYNSVASSSTAAVITGAWNHVAVVRQGANIKIYINGVLSLDETKAAWAANLSSGEDFRIGNLTNNSVTQGHWSGMIDEVRVWNVARTGAEILSNFDNIIDPASPNLVGYWRFNEGTGTTTADLSASANDGTLSGCTWNQVVTGFDSDSDGVSDDTDDYPLDPTRAFDNYYPVTSPGTLTFEDLWPWCGDYDFNDLILGYRFKTVTNASNQVVEVVGTFVVRANGGVMHNGFGFQLPDLNTTLASNIYITGCSLNHGLVTLNGATNLEAGQTKPTIIPFDDAFDLMAGIANTVSGGPSATADSVVITMAVTGGGPYVASDFALDTWNPFLFIDATRGREVHLINHLPTDLMTSSYFGMGRDASDPASNLYYQTINHLPWGLDFPVAFSYASEYNEISSAYLHFVEWAESGGTLYTDWYTNTAAGYRDPTYIYTP